MNPEANLVSFVVRFICEDTTTPDSPPTDWHGVIRHVQSNTERHFTRWTDAVYFIGQYVDVRDAAGRPAPDRAP